jgi:hypothetical protein
MVSTFNRGANTMKTTLRSSVTSKRWRTPGLLVPALLVTAALAAGTGGAEDPPKAALKTERFDKDPGWAGFNNRVEPKRVPTVAQDFGYSPTNFGHRRAAGADLPR